MMKIEMLPASEGDCLWIEYGEGGDLYRVLIDGGTSGTYTRALRNRLSALPPEQRRCELLIVTHIDSDHIAGALKLLQDRELRVQYRDIWFNGRDHLPSAVFSPAQGDNLTDELKDLPWNTDFEGKAVVVTEDELPVRELPGGLRLTLLSPTPAQLAKLGLVWERATKQAGLVSSAPEPEEEEEPAFDVFGAELNVEELAEAPFKPDAAEANGSSIAVLAEYGQKSLVLAGDAYAPVLVSSIQRLLRRTGRKKLHVDAVKLPHHGSRKNVSKDLIELLDTDNYLFSTNGARHRHPDREAVARAIHYGRPGMTLHFNYWSDFNKVWDDKNLMDAYGYKVRYPELGAEGLSLDLG